jgi:hypothetical protein
MNWTPNIIVTGTDGDSMTLRRADVEDSYRMLQPERSHAELRRLADANLLSKLDLALVARLDEIAASLGLPQVRGTDVSTQVPLQIAN